jgi:hypothetical protein
MTHYDGLHQVSTKDSAQLRRRKILLQAKECQYWTVNIGAPIGIGFEPVMRAHAQAEWAMVGQLDAQL